MIERSARIILVACGIAACGYGGWLLWELTPADRLSVVVWLAIGLFAHDAVLAPIALGVSWLLRDRLPVWWSRTLLIALGLTNVLILLALPVIAPRPADDQIDNSTMLDRNFGLGLTIVLVAVWVTVFGAATWLRHRGESLRPVPDPALFTPPAP
ncbi:hypothetical protein ACIGKQ_08475 [Gordonia sp. NPDC062954]|uniref:hypothetical protein n=1 Tax=Gordonia sp. NPDC062954 TaxID=3364003 RepID=UPI0037CB8D18